METRYKLGQSNTSHSSLDTMYDPSNNHSFASIDSTESNFSLNPQLLAPTPQPAPVPATEAAVGPATGTSRTAAAGKAAGNLVPVPVRKAGPHRKKMDPNHIKRPPNAFILFRSHFCSPGNTADFQRDSVYAPSAHQLNVLGITDHRHISRIVSHLWRSLYLWQRQYWENKAYLIKKRHQVKYPNYKYRPQHRKKRGSSVPAQVSPAAEERDLVEREKCQHIAKALIGKDSDSQSDIQESVDFLRQKNADLPSAPQKDASLVKRPRRKALTRRRAITSPRMVSRFEPQEPLTITLHAPGSTASLASTAPSLASAAPPNPPIGPFQLDLPHVLPPLPAPAVDNSPTLAGAATDACGLSTTGDYCYDDGNPYNSSNLDYCRAQSPENLHDSQSVHDLNDIAFMPDASYARDALLANEMQQQLAREDSGRGNFRHQMATHEEYTSYTRAYASRIEAAGAAAVSASESIGPYEGSPISFASSSSSSVSSFSKFSSDTDHGAFAMQQEMAPLAIDPRNLMASALAPSYMSPATNVGAPNEPSSRPRTRRAVAEEAALAAQAAHAAALESSSIVPRTVDPMLYGGHRSCRGQDAFSYHGKHDPPVFVSPWDNNNTPIVQDDVDPFTFKSNFAGSMSIDTQLVPASPEPSVKAESFTNDGESDAELESRTERLGGPFGAQDTDNEFAKAAEVRRGSKSWVIKLKQAGLGKRLSKQFKDFSSSVTCGDATAEGEKARLLGGDEGGVPKEEEQDTLFLDIRTNRTPRNSITSYMSGVLQNWQHRLSLKRGSEATIVPDANRLAKECNNGRVDEEIGMGA